MIFCNNSLLVLQDDITIQSLCICLSLRFNNVQQLYCIVSDNQTTSNHSQTCFPFILNILKVINIYMNVHLHLYQKELIIKGPVMRVMAHACM